MRRTSERSQRGYQHLLWASQELEEELSKEGLLPDGIINVGLDVTPNPPVLYVWFPKKLSPNKECGGDEEFCKEHNRMVADGTMERILNETIKRRKDLKLTSYPVDAKAHRGDLVFAYTTHVKSS